MKESFILQWYENSNELLHNLGIELTKKDKETMQQFQKEAVKYKNTPKRVEQKLQIKDYFSKEMTKEQRNEAIQKAIEDGFTQSEVARFLGLTNAAVSKILKKLKVEP